MASRKKFALFALLTFAPMVFAKQTVGYIEYVQIFPGPLEIKAKIDSGATNSSLNCTCTQVIEKNGEEWVRFTVRNYKDESVVLEKKLEGYTNVKRHFGDVQKRPVIKLGICMAGVYRKVKVNLVDRMGYNYQMLIGRSYMLDDFFISPGEKFLTRPNCPKVEE